METIHQPANSPTNAKVVPRIVSTPCSRSCINQRDGWHENSRFPPTETFVVDSATAPSNPSWAQAGESLKFITANLPYKNQIDPTPSLSGIDPSHAVPRRLVERSLEDHSVQFDSIRSFGSSLFESTRLFDSTPIEFLKGAPPNSTMTVLFPWTYYFAHHRHLQRLVSTDLRNELSQEGLAPSHNTSGDYFEDFFGSGESPSNHSPPIVDSGHWEMDFVMHGIVMVTIAIFGVLANFASFIVLTRRPMRTAVVNTYLAALSAFDGFLLLIALFLYPPMSYCEYYGSDPNSFWCRYFFHSSLILYPISLIAQTGSVWILTALTVDRFIAIIWPLGSRKWCTNSRALWATLVVLLWSILYNLPAFFELGLIDEPLPGDRDDLSQITLLDRTDLRKNASYVLIYKGYCYLIFMLLLPAGTMIALNTYVVISVRRASRTRRRSMNVSNNSSRDDKERRCTLMAALIVLVFLIFNSLAFVNNMLEGFRSEDELTTTTTFAKLVCIGNVLVALNSAMNFIIYCAMGLRFRQMFCKLFCRCCYTAEMEYQFLSVYYGSGRNHCWTNGGAAREMAPMGGDHASSSLLGGGIISMKTVPQKNQGAHPRQSLRSRISAPSTAGGRPASNQRGSACGSRISQPVDSSMMRAYQQSNPSVIRVDVQQRS